MKIVGTTSLPKRWPLESRTVVQKVKPEPQRHNSKRKLTKSRVAAWKKNCISISFSLYHIIKLKDDTRLQQECPIKNDINYEQPLLFLRNLNSMRLLEKCIATGLECHKMKFISQEILTYRFIYQFVSSCYERSRLTLVNGLYFENRKKRKANSDIKKTWRKLLQRRKFWRFSRFRYTKTT